MSEFQWYPRNTGRVPASYVLVSSQHLALYNITRFANRWLLRFFHTRADNTPEGQAIFCTPHLTGNAVTVISDVQTGNLLAVKDNGVGIPDNEVLDGSLAGKTYNG